MKEEKHEKEKILIVDDEPAVIEVFRLNFRDRYTVYTASSGVEALEIFQKYNNIGVILSDHNMPGMNGVELLTEIYTLNPDTIRIIITAFTEFQNILDAINKGHIYHYVLKPWDSIQLGIILEQGIKSWTLIKENRRLAQEQERMNKELQQLTLKIIHAQENERKRISMELHDDIGQNLIALKLQFSNFCAQLEQNEMDEAQETGLIIRSALQKSIDSTRNICQNLWPVVIEEFGFDLALQEFLDNFSRDYSIKTVVGSLHVQKYFSKEEQHQVYRIIQEIFNNIGKHSGTDRVTLNTVNGTESLRIEITDFGCGFDTKNLGYNQKEKGGLGLNTIQERATILGGTVDIESFIEKGSCFTLTLPHSGPLH